MQGLGSVKRDKAVQIFTYLRELAKYKAKPIRDISGWEVLWFDDVPKYKGFSSILDEQRADAKEHVWLEVQKPKEPKKPQVPTICKEWIDNLEDDDQLNEPHLKSDTPEQFDITSEYNEYIKQWRVWAEDFISWQIANAIYEKLFYINEQLKKLGEQYELIIGIGFLTWETPRNQVIRRHIIVGDAELIFYPDRARFQLQGASEAGTKLRFEIDMLEPTDTPSQDIEKDINNSLSDVSENPWAKVEIDTILRTWIQAANPNGVYSESITPPKKPSKQPIITFAPALILRKRTQQNQIQCFDRIVNNIAGGDKIPDGIASICEIEGNSDVILDSDRENLNLGSDEEIYMPLKINDEQKRIVRQSNQYNGVLVQGPPGTGKSHTIANLICHLMATGKRILVTSQTPRALKVLKKFIPKNVQSLCVSLLGNNQEALQELQDCVQGINKNYVDWNPGHHNRNLQVRSNELKDLKKEIVNVTNLLRIVREKDSYIHDIADGRYQGTAQKIGERIQQEEKELGWILDDIDEKQKCPLSSVEFIELINLYRGLSYDYCQELRKKVLDTNEIPDIDSFVNLIDREEKSKLRLSASQPFIRSNRFNILTKLDAVNRNLLRDCVLNLSMYINNINNRFKWVPRALHDMLIHNDAPWKNLFKLLSPQVDDLEKDIVSILNVRIVIPDSYNYLTVFADASALFNHLAKGGWVGWGFLAPPVVRKSKYIMKNVTLNGYPCNTIENLNTLIQYIIFIEKLNRAWDALINIDDKEQGSFVVQLGYLKERVEALQNILGIENYLTKARMQTSKLAGFTEPRWHDKDELSALITEIDAAEIEYNSHLLQLTIDDITEKVKTIVSRTNSHELNNEVLVAINNRDSKLLAGCLDKIYKLNADKLLLKRRKDLMEVLSKYAPVLANQLDSNFSDTNWDVFAQSFEAAWAWKRANTWIRKWNSEQDTAALELKLHQLETQKGEKISDIAAMKAWGHCLSNLTEEQRQNLITWAQEIKRIGKGTGKHAPKHRRRAQEYMEKCKDAIPAWIMPLHRVFETVNPLPEIYDVIIIDEASQTGPEGLVIRYLGKRCIIVGDSEQISPEEVGIDEAGVDSLMSKYLNGIPFQYSYDPKMSLFAHAERFRNRIPLREHFRCMPEIIQFSNQLCYTASPLIPLRQYSSDRLEPILTFYVSDGYREGDSTRAINEPEATALAKKLVEFCSLDEHADKTIGIISLQGEEQARLIQRILRDQITDAEWERRKIICGDAYAFQGDERDIIFLSMVAAPNERPVAFTRESYKQRFNVAASRAKDQMILFHSVKLEDLNPECMRYKLLKYCLNPEKAVFDSDISKCDDFEKSVYTRIIAKGYRVVPQFEIAGYFIDLMVFGSKNRLAVECDGDQWHGIERWEQDAYRQRQLERCGVRFYRIRGSDYYRQPDVALKNLWTALSDMGIYSSFIHENSFVKKHEIDEQRGTYIEKTDKDDATSSDSEKNEEQGVQNQPAILDMNDELRGSNFPCQFCGRDYTDESRLGLHYCIAHMPQNKSNLLRCPACGEKYKEGQQDQLGWHWYRIHKRGMKPETSSTHIDVVEDVPTQLEFSETHMPTEPTGRKEVGHKKLLQLYGDRITDYKQCTGMTFKDAWAHCATLHIPGNHRYQLLNQMYALYKAEKKNNGMRPIEDRLTVNATPLNSPDLYFQLAHWAKETNNLLPWERRLIYDIGTGISRKWQLSDKQITQCKRIIAEAFKLGFRYTIDEK